MDFINDSDNARLYLRSSENMNRCRPFIEKFKRLEEIKLSYSEHCNRLFRSLYTELSEKRFSTQSKLHMGIYCPSKIMDAVLSQEEKGRLISKYNDTAKPVIEYGFDQDDRPVTVKRLDTGELEAVLYDGNSSLGLGFFPKENGAALITSVSECEYAGRDMPTTYRIACFDRDGVFDNMVTEMYFYKNRTPISADRFMLTFSYGYPMLEYIRYEFNYSRTEELISYTRTDISTRWRYGKEESETVVLNHKYEQMKYL